MSSMERFMAWARRCMPLPWERKSVAYLLCSIRQHTTGPLATTYVDPAEDPSKKK